MRWAPERHVLAEDAMPDIVERETDHRVQTAGRHQQPADRRVPVAGDAQRSRPRLVERQHHGQHAAHEDAEQADDDEVMRRVCQGTRVAAVADVPADIPDEPEQGADDRGGEHHDGQCDPRRAVELTSQPFRDGGQPRDAVRAMRPPDVQHDRTDHHRGDRQTDHLIQSGAARRRLCCKKCQIHCRPSHRLVAALTQSGANLLHGRLPAGRLFKLRMILLTERINRACRRRCRRPRCARRHRRVACP